MYIFEASATAAQQCMGSLESRPQHLTNTAWAFATVGQKDKLLFTALAMAVQRRMEDLIPQELASTAWAFATLGQKDD